MAMLATKGFVRLVQDQAAAIQARSKTLIDFTIGSILRAMVESNSSVALWLQGLVLQVLALTRAATSSGPDLDTWVNDFGVTRLAARPSSGSVTFSRFTTSIQAVVPVGAQVRTGDGAQGFTVVLDAANTSYNAGLGGYVIPVGVASAAVPVKADVPSAASNVVAGAITSIATPIPYVDTVTNVGAFSNGSDAESDAALRARFRAFIASLAKATKTAIGYAITSLQLGMQYTLVENQQYNGATDNGYFYVVVDDGTGAPPSSVLSNVYAAVDLVRPVGSRFGVFAPVVQTASVSMIVTVAPGYDGPTVKGQVGQAITTHVNGLPLGATLYYNRLAQVAFDASPGVANVSSILLNGGTADLAATARQIVKVGSVAVS